MGKTSRREFNCRPRGGADEPRVAGRIELDMALVRDLDREPRKQTWFGR